MPTTSNDGRPLTITGKEARIAADAGGAQESIVCTTVLVDAPIDWRDLFRAMTVALLAAAGGDAPRRRLIEKHFHWTDGTATVETSTIENGLPGIVAVNYRCGGPLNPTDQYDDGTLIQRTCYIQAAWISTTLQAGDAEGIGDLHARCLRQLREQIPTDVPLRWVDPTNGEAHGLEACRAAPQTTQPSRPSGRRADILDEPAVWPVHGSAPITIGGRRPAPGQSSPPPSPALAATGGAL